MAFSDGETRRGFSGAFKVFPVLQTERLVLSEILAEEAEVYYRELRSALEMVDRPPWGFGLESESAEQARRSILFAENAWKKKQGLRFGLRLRGDEGEGAELIGMVSLFDFQNQYKAEVGYWLGAAYQGRGIMTEALRAVVAHVFGVMGMNRVYALTSVENAASLRMLEKVGFVREGVLREDTRRDGRWDDSVVMGMVRKDWGGG